MFIEVVNYIPSHNISGFEEENMVHGLDCVFFWDVLMSQYQFLRSGEGCFQEGV